LNKEEPTRYVRETSFPHFFFFLLVLTPIGLFGPKTTQVPEESCDYLVDFEMENQSEKRYSQDSSWKVLKEIPFLDTAHSKPFYRAFYIPFVSTNHTTYRPYFLFKRIK
jgi:hypothetical protein